jgi:hypothetical protein
VIAIPRQPPLPSALAITHTHVAAHARVTAPSKARGHYSVIATTKEHTQATS